MTKSIELRFEGASLGRTADPKVQKLMFPWTGVYGPRIKGQLVFRHQEDITLKALTLHFKAKISCNWSEKRGNKTHYFQAKKVLLEKEWIFLAKGDKLHLLKGNQTYTYDFDLALPVNLPNSLNMSTGKIEYKFTANGKRQTFQLDLDTVRTIDIYQSLPPNHPHCLNPIQSTATFENALQYHLQLPHKAFHHGSTIPARVHLSPLAGVATQWHIKHLEVKLKEYFWFIVPEKGYRPEKRTLVSSKQDQWPQETGIIDRMVNINVPAFNIMSTTATELIKCSHKLKFKFSVDINGKTKKLSIDFDLYIPGPFPPGQMPAGYAPVGHQPALQLAAHQPAVQHTGMPVLVQQPTCSQTVPLVGQPAAVAYGQQNLQFQHQQPYQALTTPLTPSNASSSGFPSPGYPPPSYPPSTPASAYNLLPQHPAPPPTSTPTPPTPATALTSLSTPSLPSYSLVNNYPTMIMDNSHLYQSSSTSSASYPKPPTPQQPPQPPLQPPGSSSPFMAASVPPASSTPKTAFGQAFGAGNHSVVTPPTPTSHPQVVTPTQSPYTPVAPVPPPRPNMSSPPSMSSSSLPTLPLGSDKAAQSLAPPLPTRSEDIKVLVDDLKHQTVPVTHSQNPQTIVAPTYDPPRNPQQRLSQSDLVTAVVDGALLSTVISPQMSQYPQPPPPPVHSVAAPMPTSSTAPLAHQLGQMSISKPAHSDQFVPPPPPPSVAPAPPVSTSSSSSSSPPNPIASPGGYTAPPLSPVTSQVMSPMTAAAAGAVVAATQAASQNQHPPGQGPGQGPPPLPPKQQQQQQHQQQHQQQQQQHTHQQQQQQQQYAAHSQVPPATPKRQQVWVPFYQTINGTTYVKYVPQHI